MSLASVDVAYPAAVRQDELWAGFFAGHYPPSRRAAARRVFANSGVVTRHAAVNPVLEDVSGWSTARRMSRFLAEALPLGTAAVSGALARAGVAPAQVGLLVVCSCTGYVTPGLDILLARDLGLPADAQRLFVGHMGCYAAMPGLRAAADFVAAVGRPAVLVCVELTSLHIQPASAELEQIVSHALFSDAAAAAVLVPDPSTGGRPAPGHLRVREVASVTDADTADQMTWQVTDLGFRMGLSARVPEVLDRHLPGFVAGLLARNGVKRSDVDEWVVHPGGPRVLDVAEDGLGLPPGGLVHSRAVLAEHGNCSSPTVLAVLDRAWRSRPATVVMLAFGPGLTVTGALLTAHP